jgi:NAD+ synthase
MQEEKIIVHIVDWLKNYAEKANCKGFVVGVSGGIDSALTSTLTAKTALPTLLLEMPIHQASSQVSRAQKHIAFLKDQYSNVESEQVELTETYAHLQDAFPKSVDSDAKHMALVNTRARLRMTTLYYFAGLHGYLVAGTGNKVEDFGVGFYTKYGDGGVDVSPIADLLKSEVYQLAAKLNVNDEILQAPPTDGLWGDNRTDEDQIGASYNELEWAMDQDGKNKKPTDFDGREAEVMSIYIRLNRANQHKMQPIPVCNIPKKLKLTVG